MFQFPALALTRLYIQRAVMPCYRHCVSTFRNLRINACLPASRSLSQAAASFFASRCQDIHRTPLVSLTSWIEDRPTHLLRHAFQSLQQAGLLRQQVLERCPLRRKDQRTIFQKQASQKSLILTRTSYLVVKEHVLPAPIFIKARKATRQARVNSSSNDGGFTHA